MLDYRDEIIDHYKNPRNFGDLLTKTHAGKGINMACGDMVEFYLRIEDEEIRDQVIREVKWRGVGCAMSTAAASLLSEKIKGMTLEEVGEVDEKVVEELVGEVNPGRVKCVLLPLSAIKEAVKNKI